MQQKPGAAEDVEPLLLFDPLLPLEPLEFPELFDPLLPFDPLELLEFDDPPELEELLREEEETDELL